MNLKVLAQSLGVSPASISIVRKGHSGVSAQVRARIQRALEENGYAYIPYSRENSEEKPAFEMTNRNILLLKYYDSSLLVNHNDGFVDSIISSLDATARMEHFTLVINAVSKHDYPRFLNGLSPASWAGVLVIATEMSRSEILMLQSVHIPMVILDSDYPNLPISTVAMDNRSLAFAAVEYLKSRGEVGFLSSRIPTGNFDARTAGYREALNAFGMTYREDIVFQVTPGLSGACQDMQDILARGCYIPKAIFSANDILAVGAMKALIQAGYHVPDDVAIIGVDNTMIAQVSTPTLSSMAFSRHDLGQLAIRHLIQEICDPNQCPVHFRVGAQLILRDSTDCKA